MGNQKWFHVVEWIKTRVVKFLILPVGALDQKWFHVVEWIKTILDEADYFRYLLDQKWFHVVEWIKTQARYRSGHALGEFIRSGSTL